MTKSTRGSLLVLSAPSGTGKSSLGKRLLAADARVTFSVSATTRDPRPGERDGRDYHFLAPERFVALVKEGAFLEHAEVHGRLYGTLRDATERILASGRDVLLDIDVQGARSVLAAFPEAQLIFILPPSAAELERRLRVRSANAESDIELRLHNARSEVADVGRFQWVIVNDDIEEAAAELIALVSALRSRRVASRTRTCAILATFGLPESAADSVATP